MGPSKRAIRRRSSAALGLGALLAVALAAVAFSAVPGLELVVRTAPDVPDSINHKVAGAPCPPDKRVVGAGGSATGQPGQHALTGLLPDAGGEDLVQVNAVGDEDQDGDGSLWRATAVAVCADPCPGSSSSRSPEWINSANKSTIASCPPGKLVVGAGGAVSRANSGAPLGDVAMDDMAPIAGLSGVKVTGLEDQDGADATGGRRPTPSAPTRCPVSDGSSGRARPTRLPRAPSWTALPVSRSWALAATSTAATARSGSVDPPARRQRRRDRLRGGGSGRHHAVMDGARVRRLRRRVIAAERPPLGRPLRAAPSTNAASAGHRGASGEPACRFVDRRDLVLEAERGCVLERHGSARQRHRGSPLRDESV